MQLYLARILADNFFRGQSATHGFASHCFKRFKEKLKYEVHKPQAYCRKMEKIIESRYWWETVIEKGNNIISAKEIVPSYVYCKYKERRGDEKRYLDVTTWFFAVLFPFAIVRLAFCQSGIGATWIFRTFKPLDKMESREGKNARNSPPELTKPEGNCLLLLI